VDCFWYSPVDGAFLQDAALTIVLPLSMWSGGSNGRAPGAGGSLRRPAGGTPSWVVKWESRLKNVYGRCARPAA
jgi:hypothetical protein